MKLNQFLILILLGMLVMAGCRSKKKAISGQEPAVTEYVKTPSCKPMLLEEEPFLPIASDIYDLDTAWVSGNCLHITVMYSGGCGETDFQLYYNNRIMKSYPPQTNLFLSFTDNDPCRAVVKDTLSFDLSPFEAMARAGGVYLNISGHNRSVMFALPLD